MSELGLTDVPAVTPDEPSRQPTGFRGLWVRFRRQRGAMTAAVVILVLAAAGLAAPWLAPYEIDHVGDEFMGSFSSDHWLGTDNRGYDILTRLLFATRTSLLASLIAVGIAVTGGTLLGLVSGYVGRWVDTVLMRVADAIMTFPGLLTAMAMVAILGNGIFNAMIGLSVAFMPGFARLVRGQVLAVREESYVEAARVIGASSPHIIRRHILPNIASPLIVQVFMSMGFALLAEGALAFLGLSVQPPDTSLGSMLQEGFSSINATPRLVLVPGLMITLLSLCFNAVADGIRDAMARHVPAAGAS